MHPHKKRRSSGSSASASDMDPPLDPKDTSELNRTTAAKGDKGDKGRGGKGKGGSTAKQQQAEVSKEPTAGGVLVCAWLCGYACARLTSLLHVCLALCAFGFVRVRFQQRPSLRCGWTNSRATGSRQQRPIQAFTWNLSAAVARVCLLFELFLSLNLRILDFTKLLRCD
jgi:hypothetical protein